MELTSWLAFPKLVVTTGLGCGFKDHLCHPSVRDIEGVRREALLVFDVRDAIYQSI